MLHALIVTWFNWVHDWGYLGIVILMAMESSIFPVPSEIVIPPAAFFIAEGKMSFWGVILAGTAGSYMGAAITYWIALGLGRPFVIRFGKYFFISEEKLEMSERWMHRYEAGGIFFARLLPVIRHLISIPAGIVKMSFGVFSAMTVVGSFLWVMALAWLGQKAQQAHPDLIKDPQALLASIKSDSHLIVAGIAVLCVLYFAVMKLAAKPAQEPSGA